MKGRNDHIIPLPEEAMAILREIEPPDTAPDRFRVHWCGGGWSH